VDRRTVLRCSASAAFSLSACSAAPPPLPPCHWVGVPPERGHRLRSPGTWPAPSVQRRAQVLVLGGGVAGLAALRQLAQAGVEAQLLELADAIGGNSQGHQLAGMACPLGAHYLPVPGAAAPEVSAWLHDIGLLRRVAGVSQPDERHLCHAPQERLFIDGAWQDGVLPSAQGRPATLAQYRRFAQLVDEARRRLAFSMPSIHSAWTSDHAALDAQSFAAWLAAQGLQDERLLGYLDYCCRDDYGAGLPSVSAWAGLHYFASRHGFHVPGDEVAEREPVFTWPDGNAFLVRALAAPLRERLHTGQTVLRLHEGKHGLELWVWSEAAQRTEAWTAQAVVLALPLFIAARLLADWADPLAGALHEAAQRQPHAPWLVANLHVAEPLLPRLGTPAAWDNLRFTPAGSALTLGYVDNMHQSLRPYASATVLTAYQALPVAQRPALLGASAEHWGAQVLADLALLHPDAPQKVRAIHLTRWGHGMSIPAPGVRGSTWLAALRAASGRIRFAHSDLAGYSVFEEAFTLGDGAGRALARWR
jgi:predicted NAD/FAD-dependent oxidoreductase